MSLTGKGVKCMPGLIFVNVVCVDIALFGVSWCPRGWQRCKQTTEAVELFRSYHSIQNEKGALSSAFGRKIDKKYLVEYDEISGVIMSSYELWVYNCLYLYIFWGMMMIEQLTFVSAYWSIFNDTAATFNHGFGLWGEKRCLFAARFWSRRHKSFVRL